jgi:hypothetical protein
LSSGQYLTEEQRQGTRKEPVLLLMLLLVVLVLVQVRVLVVPVLALLGLVQRMRRRARWVESCLVGWSRRGRQ